MKRRLAWSTVSNLSYILFGTALMSPLGLVGALCHMICHAVIKICSFFCAGAVICQSGREYITQLDGLGRKMPKVFTIFTISGLALMGVPGLAGFIGKWNLVKAALDSSHPLAVVGVAALMISALLTAIYMLTISVRAFVNPAPESAVATEQSEKPLNGEALPDGGVVKTASADEALRKDDVSGTSKDGKRGNDMLSGAKKAEEHKIVPYEEVKDPGWMMLLPLVIFVVAMVVIGLHPQPLIDVFTQIASAIN